MKTIDFKIKNGNKFEYYSVYHEREEYIFSENLHNMGVIYTIRDRFRDEVSLKAYMSNIEARYNEVFERV